MKQVFDKQCIIFTIGHGNRKIEEFINLLFINQIDVLIDVRSLPYSRFNPQFRQAHLKHSLNIAGMTYLWLGTELGGRPADPNLYRNGKADYQKIKETELFKSGIQQVMRLAAAGIKLTLMCSESNPNECHRKHLIADELAKLGINVLHINKCGIIERNVNINNYGLFS